MGDRVSAPRNEGIGLTIPERKADCTGRRPEWFPFQIQVDACEGDAPDPVPITAREQSIGAAQPIPWWPFPEED